MHNNSIIILFYNRYSTIDIFCVSTYISLNIWQQNFVISEYIRQTLCQSQTYLYVMNANTRATRDRLPPRTTMRLNTPSWSKELAIPVETPLAIPPLGCGKPWIAPVYSVSMSLLRQHLRQDKSNYKIQLKGKYKDNIIRKENIYNLHI